MAITHALARPLIAAMFVTGGVDSLRNPESKVAVDACRKVAPDYPACALLEANVLKKLGKEKEALAAYDRAIKLAQKIDPDVKGKRNDLSGSGSGSGAVAPAVADKDDPAAEYKAEAPTAAKSDPEP